jgi:hypothetical protein
VVVEGRRRGGDEVDGGVGRSCGGGGALGGAGGGSDLGRAVAAWLNLKEHGDGGGLEASR